MKNIKSDFTVTEIGKFRFYSGVAIGIGFSFTFNTLFRQISKIAEFRPVVDESSWNRIIDYELTFYYLTLIGFTSVAFAFCFTTYLWMSRPFARIKRKTTKLRFAQTNSMWIFFGTLLFLIRMIWVIGETDISIENDFPYLGFMVPIFIYMYCWNLISDIYKSKKPFVLTSLIFIISGLLLSRI